MPGDQRHVDIAGLANRLSVVERFEHGEEAVMFLYRTGERVQIAGPAVAADSPPLRLGLPRGAYRAVYVRGTRLGEPSQRLSCRGIERLEGLGSRRCPLAGDEQPKGPAVLLQPGLGRCRRFWSRPVGHRMEDLRNGCHVPPE